MSGFDKRNAFFFGEPKIINVVYLKLMFGYQFP